MNMISYTQLEIVKRSNCWKQIWPATPLFLTDGSPSALFFSNRAQKTGAPFLRGLHCSICHPERHRKDFLLLWILNPRRLSEESADCSWLLTPLGKGRGGREKEILYWYHKGVEFSYGGRLRYLLWQESSHESFKQAPWLTSLFCENEQLQVILRKRSLSTSNDMKQEWNHKNKTQQIHGILQNNAWR